MKKKIFFPKKKIVGKRNWGKEELLVLIPKVLTLKKLFIKKGNRGGLQFHRKKNECGYLVKGKMLIKYDDGSGRLKNKIIKKGQSFHFLPKGVHQEIALENCEIIEASTPHFDDRVRVEKKYNLKVESGLPTTKLKEIKIR